ncbi:MAG: phosphoribosylformylglycinamidine synthase subunit PurL, partial [Microvirga sp.]
MIANDVPITPELVKEHGLKEDEYRRFRDLIGREPTLTELGIVSAMWNEHCSYKSSRLHLRTLPTSAPWVIQGPGENAGVIDIGDGLACVFKMESHNHPSFIEPYQGAATGVGGILRDVFTMGARPIAALNSLRFGAPDHPRTRHLVAGVVAGIGGYGNSFGVPTVGGSVGFHRRYNGNILVNAMAVGLARTDEIFYAAATGVGDPIVYLGSKTGRDGIHGATMASAEFDESSHEKRPTVQVGDPFAEKLLLEACLELMASGAVIAIQDMGAAGLTCSAVEMGAKGDLGVELDLDRVPCREKGMTAYEMMLSESQERMLMVLRPGMESEAEAIFRKWGLDFAIIGRTTDTLRFVVKHRGEVMADLPIKDLGDEAPIYDRPHLANTYQPVVAPESIPTPVPNTEALLRLVGSPDQCSKRWVYEQYDHFILGNTIATPGGDAAIVRIENGPKGLALTTDVTPRYCEADPVDGGKQAVAEAWRNITAVGGRPLAVTDNLNFGSPERPEVMGQFVGCIRGIGEACRALDFP